MVEDYPSGDGFCAVTELTSDIPTIMRCVASHDQTHCEMSTNPGCSWYRGKTVASNTDFVDGGKVFYENLCMPATLAGMASMQTHCMNQRSQSSCSQAGCLWSTGAHFIPVHGDFCSAEFVSTDPTNFNTCPTYTDSSSCSSSSGCKWYCQPPPGSNPTDCGALGKQFWDLDTCSY
jgi:hypothetical protein